MTNGVGPPAGRATGLATPGPEVGPRHKPRAGACDACPGASATGVPAGPWQETHPAANPRARPAASAMP
ncbi:hypothetical protein AB0903_25615, partial [Streptomyces sp. NPDC048389]|uniref:hypothetical protein n=1 Tax=Streptomyces sp. NPDC048389 TaxID=3154622 RepID=UPI003455265D